jgi:hypothetical protein
MSAIELGNYGINFYSNLQPGVITDQTGISMAQLQNSRMMTLQADFSSSTLPILTLSSGSRVFPVSFVVNETTHATSKRACIQIGNWQLLQDMTGNGTRNFAIYGNGNTRLAILPNGNVGIGTANPGNQFEVFGGSILHKNSSTSASAAFTMSNGNFLTIEAFNSDNSAKLPVTLNAYGGNVGIGTTDPQAKLDVRNTLIVGDFGSAGFYNSNAALHVRRSGVNPHIIMENIGAQTSAIALISGGVVYAIDAANGYHAFRNSWSNGTDASSTGTERMRINSTGVGIGTNNPEAPLSIRNSSTSTDPRYSMVDCFNVANTAGQSSIISNRIGGSSAGVVYYSMDVTGSYGFSMGMRASSSRLSFINGWNFTAGTGSEVMSLYANGYSIGLPKYTGSATSVNGVGMYTSDGFDAAGTSHTLSIFPNTGTANADNFTGILYVVGKNTAASTSSKVGIYAVGVIKRYGFALQLVTTFVNNPWNMTTWFISTSNNVVTMSTDSDVRVAWQFFVGI